MASIHDGHRRRFDEKMERMDFAFLEEHEQLEKILFNVMPRGDVNALAHRLIDAYGSLYGVLTTHPSELSKIDGVGNRVAQYLYDLLPLLGCVERCVMQEGSKENPYLTTTEARGHYAKTLFYGKLTECCFLISLDRKQRAYRFDKISEGDPEETPLYMREIVKLAMRNGAKAVILAHNHPSGNREPSMADLSSTRILSRGLSTMGIPLLDHLIVSCGEYFSMKEHGIDF